MQPEAFGEDATGRIAVLGSETRRSFPPLPPSPPPPPKKGYVAYPKINMMAEMVDALVASRAYEANIGAMEITKNMATQSLRILV